MKRRLTINSTAIQKSVFERHEPDQPTPEGRVTIPAGEIVEFIESDGPNRLWVRWRGVVWSIGLDVWATADPV